MTDASRYFATPDSVHAGAEAGDDRTLGARLREAREARGLALPEAARELRIREDFLRALESGRFAGMPSLPYAQGFVRSYATFLRLDEDDALARFRAEAGQPAPKPKLVLPEPMKAGRWPGIGVVVTSIVIGGALYGIWYYYQSDRGATVPPQAAERPLPAPAAVAARPPVENAEANVRSTPGAPTGNGHVAGEGGPANAQPAKPPRMPEGAGLADPRPPGAKPGEPPTPPKPAAPAAKPIEVLKSAALPPPPKPVEAAKPAEPPQPTPAKPPETAKPPDAPKPAETPKVAEAGAEKKPEGAEKPAAPAPRVVIRVTGYVTVQFVDPKNGRLYSQHNMRPGNVYIPPRPELLAINANNAAALTIELNGRTLKPLGAPGQALYRFSLAPEDLGKRP